jgi:ubiquinone/menaquinone biosynthesis C-methylase UbiE
VLKQYVPQSIKTLFKDQIWVFAVDTIDRLSGRRGKDIPPTRLMFDGPVGLKEFILNGQEFFNLFLSLIKPHPSDRILDIGSGIGRKTLPLTKYLNKRGSYEGIEIVQKGVDWCQDHITKRFPNFKFTRVDIYNGFYNPQGKILPAAYTFPFPDNYVDIVIAASVFTHMLPGDVKHYLQEIDRVLKINGRCYLTYFLINSNSQKHLPDAENTLPFRPASKKYWSTRPDTPEIAVAYPEKDIRTFYRVAGLNIANIHYGSWSGQTKSLSYQDIIIAFKK